MSARDIENGQCETCERTGESNVLVTAMDDIFVKNHIEETFHDNESSVDQNGDYAPQEADGVVENLKDFLESTVIDNSVPVATTTKSFFAVIRHADFLVQTDLQKRFKHLSAALLDSSLSLNGESCTSESFKIKRDMFIEELQKTMKFESLWTELRQQIRVTFNTIVEIFRSKEMLPPRHDVKRLTHMHDIVEQLSRRNPHQLFMRLVSLAQEFVVEVKVRLLALLHDSSIHNIAEIFLMGLLDDYNALIFVAARISELVDPLKNYLNFDFKWHGVIKKLYHACVYNDPLVQNNLPLFIGQLRKLLPLKGSEYQGLVHRYLTFDDDMTRVGQLWPETEPWMDKYNTEEAVQIIRLRQITEALELHGATEKLMEQRTLSETSDSDIDLQDMDRQLSVLTEEQKSIIYENTNGSDDFTNIDLGFDGSSVPPIFEILQILLDDWNTAQHKKLADIVGGLSHPKTLINKDLYSESPADVQAAHQLAQLVLNSARTQNQDVSVGTVIETPDDCDCFANNVSSSSLESNEKSVENNEPSTDIVNCLPSINNGFIEDIVGNTATQVKKKTEGEESKQTSIENLTETNETNSLTTTITTSEPKPCSCVYQHARDIAERKKEILENPPCPCLLNSKKRESKNICPCLIKTETEIAVTKIQSRPPSPVTPIKKLPIKPDKMVTKTATQSAQTQTRHSTTQTPNVTRNSTTNQGNLHAHAHGPPPDLVKNTNFNHHRSHTHNNRVQHGCHKQANIEQIKRVSCNDRSSGDGDCSDSASSQEDSCSTSSSVHVESRHCDCCYCEVFGHGVPSVAPVSRNYKQMRERLRILLTKKKANIREATCRSPSSPSESSISNTNSETKTGSSRSNQRSNTPISTTPTVPQNQRDEQDLTALLEFIEGNPNGKKENNKKAEKKARQKQKKLEEKLKKDRQEVEKQKLIELQKKTPEVTITVVDPQKPVSQRLLPQCTLPEVSILPTFSPVFSSTNRNSFNNNNTNNNNNNISNNSNNKLQNNKRKDKNETGCNVNVKTKPSVANCNVKNKSNNDKSVSSTKTIVKNDNNTNTNSKTSSNVNSKTTVNNSTTLQSKETIDPSDKPSTKKERKKLRREMKKLEEAKSKKLEKRLQNENQPQIVTIKRVMESNGSEPTVTITLKGQTPAEDKVLFTLVNGQTKEPSQKKEQDQNQSGKKKKNKSINNNSGTQQGNNKSTPPNNQNNNKKQTVKATNDNNKKHHQTANLDKTKIVKQVTDEKETKSNKTKKEKRNNDNKENISQQQSLSNNKNEKNQTNKKPNKTNASNQQTLLSQKPPKNSTTSPNDSVNKKPTKNQQQLQNEKTKNTKVSNQIDKSAKNPSKNPPKSNNDSSKKIPLVENPKPNTVERINSPLSSQLKDIGSNTKINIENLKLPPGITITKVDAPAKPLPIKSAPMPKANNSAKQTTIIAAPMSGVQSSYGGPQAAGNVIVVDTGKLKQDLLPKSTPKEQTSSTSNKKKKKKNKNPTNANPSNNSNVQNKDGFVNDPNPDEPARILHNPGTNMVTIRNPAFGPMKVTPTQQAAIIKVSENGMVTIRSPALQQAINAGLTTPAKPDFIVRGDVSTNKTKTTHETTIKNTNGIISSSLAELRSRLTPECPTLTGLANIQISKVANGHPIPESGINLKGTSVTLTKVKNNGKQEVQQIKPTISPSMVAATASTSTTAPSSKGKKKKKRGNGSRQCRDDWNLVESVFTPKDIDLEDGEMDDAERELEAFKRFCLQSVPPPRKEKVNLNIKDIVLKKKSSSTAAAAAAIAAN